MCLFLDWRRSRWRVKPRKSLPRCSHTDTGRPCRLHKDKLCLKAKTCTFTLPGHCAISHAVPFLLLLFLILQIPHSNPVGNAQLEKLIRQSLSAADISSTLAPLHQKCRLFLRVYSLDAMTVKISLYYDDDDDITQYYSINCTYLLHIESWHRHHPVLLRKPVHPTTVIMKSTDDYRCQRHQNWRVKVDKETW